MKPFCAIVVFVICIAAGFVVVVLTRDAAAQSGSRSTGSARAGSGNRPQNETQKAPSTPFEVKLWQFLRNSHYENWAPFPGADGDFVESQSPHGAYVKIFVNRTAASDPKGLPHGSILIKENYGEDKATLMAVTIMYKTKNFDADHNDWHWAKYDADGVVSRMDQMKIAGKVSMCIECHSQAKGDDFVFGNDER